MECRRSRMGSGRPLCTLPVVGLNSRQDMASRRNTGRSSRRPSLSSGKSRTTTRAKAKAPLGTEGSRRGDPERATGYFAPRGRLQSARQVHPGAGTTVRSQVIPGWRDLFNFKIDYNLQLYYPKTVQSYCFVVTHNQLRATRDCILWCRIITVDSPLKSPASRLQLSVSAAS